MAARKVAGANAGQIYFTKLLGYSYKIEYYKKTTTVKHSVINSFYVYNHGIYSYSCIAGSHIAHTSL